MLIITEKVHFVLFLPNYFIINDTQDDHFISPLFTINCMIIFSRFEETKQFDDS